MITSEDFKKSVEESTATWGESHQSFGRLLKSKELKIGVEIGVAYGGHAEAILNNPNIEKLYGVDPYQHKEEETGVMNFSQEDFDDFYKHALDRLAKFGARYKSIRKPSPEAAGDVPDNLDFVYIDGDHSYEAVQADIGGWFEKVRNGGIIAGDDYGHPDLPGVKKAVDDFFRRFGWKVNEESGRVWWVEKKPLNISFFIPTYNYGKPIDEAVDSIMETNFSESDELIIVDDGSTDKTAEYLKAINEKYPQIKIITHRRNKGPSSARNTAVDNCSNPLLFSFDHDNMLSSRSIEKLKQFMIKESADAAVLGEVHFFIDDPNQITHKWVYKKGPYTLSDCLSQHHTPVADGNYLFTKDSYLRAGGYPNSWMDSWGFGISQLATGSKMMTMPGSHYFHRYNHSHDYESTYIKGEEEGRISSLMMLPLLIPYLNLLEPRDADYIMGRGGRKRWYKQLPKRPIRVKFETVEEYKKYVGQHGESTHGEGVVRKTRAVFRKNELLHSTYKKIKQWMNK